MFLILGVVQATTLTQPARRQGRWEAIQPSPAASPGAERGGGGGQLGARHIPARPDVRQTPRGTGAGGQEIKMGENRNDGSVCTAILPGSYHTGRDFKNVRIT